MAKLVSKTYGEALFELAVEENKLDALMEEVEAVIQVLDDNEDFVKLMCHPKICVEEKCSVLETVFHGRVSDELTGFFLTIEDKGRFKEIYDILSYFSLLVLIPIFAAKDSKFARFRANQGLVLMIAEVVYWIAVAIVTAIFMAINWWLGSIFSMIFALGNILFLVLAILGIVAAAQGQYKALPIIGKISILK